MTFDSTVSFTFTSLVIAAFLVSYWLTGRMRRYALAVSLLDHPNERSSHTTPTPRGGGVAIVTTFLLVVLALGIMHRIDGSLLGAVFCGGLIVATLGYVDDRKHLPARWRFAGHALAVAWILWLFSPLPAVPAFAFSLELGLGTVLLAGVYSVWSINLFNFMDGIDGIASLEAICVAVGGAFVWFLANPTGDWPLALLFAACVGGFLVWNFPPAKIFMGDAGSGFLGLVVAIFAIWSARSNAQLFWCWFILSGCFMVDATTTLIRRVLRGESFHLAHRSHAYQYAARIFKSHRTVSLAVVAINAFWLLPFAVFVSLGWIDGVVAVLISYAPLIYLSLHFKAGDRAAQEIQHD